MTSPLLQHRLLGILRSRDGRPLYHPEIGAEVLRERIVEGDAAPDSPLPDCKNELRTLERRGLAWRVGTSFWIASVETMARDIELEDPPEHESAGIASAPLEPVGHIGAGHFEDTPAAA
jgi:hypothetical protein